MGYHYPRSLYTATKSKDYFNKFVKDYDFCINDKFWQVYATSSNFSWTNGEKFKKFCKSANIKCEENSCGQIFLKKECAMAHL